MYFSGFWKLTVTEIDSFYWNQYIDTCSFSAWDALLRGPHGFLFLSLRILLKYHLLVWPSLTTIENSSSAPWSLSIFVQTQALPSDPFPAHLPLDCWTWADYGKLYFLVWPVSWLPVAFGQWVALMQRWNFPPALFLGWCLQQCLFFLCGSSSFQVHCGFCFFQMTPVLRI